jgi:spoIIIJ-associated protein
MPGEQMVKKKSKQTTEDEIQNALAELLKMLQVEAKLTVVAESEDHYSVNIEAAESGLLIGHHGDTINGLQLLLGVILYKKLGKWVRVVLDVGDYRKAREDNIREMVERIVTEVETTAQPVTLPYLSPLERRLVHVMAGEHASVISESFGEGRDRRVTIRPHGFTGFTEKPVENTSENDKGPAGE